MTSASRPHLSSCCRGCCTLLVVVLLMLLTSCCSTFADSSTTVGSFNFSADAAPVTIGYVNPESGMTATLIAEFGAALDGVKIALQAANRSGGIHGRPLRLVTADNAGSAAQSVTALDNLLRLHNNSSNSNSNNNTPVVALLNMFVDQIIAATLPQLEAHRLPMIGPQARGQEIRNAYHNNRTVFLLGGVDAQTTAIAKYLAHERKVRRVGVYIHVHLGRSSLEEAAHYKAFLAANATLGRMGIAVTSTFVADVRFDYGLPNNFSFCSEFDRFEAGRPQAVLMLGYPLPTTSNFISNIFSRFGPTFIIAAADGIESTIAAVLAQSPQGTAGQRIGVALAAPLLSDTRWAAVRRLRAEAALATGLHASPTIDASPSRTNLVMGWLHATFLVEILRSMDEHKPITGDAVTAAIFSARTFPIEDMLFGVFAGPCLGPQRSMCECNDGCHYVGLGRVGDDGNITAVEGVALEAPLGECGSEGTVAPPPLVVLQSVPSTAAAATAPYAAVSADLRTAMVVCGQQLSTTRVPLFITIVDHEGTGNGTLRQQLQGAVATVRDRIVSVVAGTVFRGTAATSRDAAVSDVASISAGLAVVSANDTSSMDPILVVEPIYEVPTLYRFERLVLRLTPTLDQELHAAASYAVQQLQAPLALAAPSTYAFAPDNNGAPLAAIIQTLEKSMNTFGVSANAPFVGSGDGGSLGAVLDSIPDGADALALFALGMRQTSDALALARLLARRPATVVVLPFHHVVLWNDALTEVLRGHPPAVQERLLVGSNLGPWNTSLNTSSGTTSSTNALGPVEAHFVAGGLSVARTAAAFLGHMTQHFIDTIAARITDALTADEMARRVYSGGVVALGESLFAGVYSDAACETGSGRIVGECASSAGARSVSLMRFATAAGLLAPRAAEPLAAVHTVAFESVRVLYTPLPVPPGPNWGMIGGVTGAGVVFALLIVIIVALRLRKFLSDAAAPKDPSKPFTLIFTDVQSSTALWADVPEAMAKALAAHHALIRQLIAKYNGYEVKTVGDSFMIAFKSPTAALGLAVAMQRTFLAYDWGTDEIDDAYREQEAEKLAKEQAQQHHHQHHNDAAPNTRRPSRGALPSVTLDREEYRKVWAGLRVRVGIHTGMGDIVLDEISHRYDYYGTVANVAARTESVGHGGQVVVTDGFRAAVEEEGGGSSQGVATSGFVALGAVELRGVPKPVALFEVPIVPGRRHPDLRWSHATALEGEKDYTRRPDTHTESHRSSLTTSTTISDKALHYNDPGMNTVAVGLRVGLSRLKLPRQIAVYEEACRAWQVEPPGGVVGKERLFACLDLLARRLGPIATVKLNKGAAAAADHFSDDLASVAPSAGPRTMGSASGNSGFLPSTSGRSGGGHWQQIHNASANNAVSSVSASVGDELLLHADGNDSWGGEGLSVALPVGRDGAPPSPVILRHASSSLRRSRVDGGPDIGCAGEPPQQPHHKNEQGATATAATAWPPAVLRGRAGSGANIAVMTTPPRAGSTACKGNAAHNVVTFVVPGLVGPSDSGAVQHGGSAGRHPTTTTGSTATGNSNAPTSASGLPNDRPFASFSSSSPVTPPASTPTGSGMPLWQQSDHLADGDGSACSAEVEEPAGTLMTARSEYRRVHQGGTAPAPLSVLMVSSADHEHTPPSSGSDHNTRPPTIDMDKQHKTQREEARKPRAGNDA